MTAVVGLAGAIISGLFAILCVLLKVLLSRIDEAKHTVEDTKHAVEPISNGFAAQTTAKLDRLAQCQDETRKDLRVMKSDIRNLQSADDTLLELMTQMGRTRQ